MEKNKYIFFELHKCSRLINRYIDNNTDKEKYEKLTGVHSWAIGFFYHNRDRDVFQRDFEKECNVRRSSATEMLKRMEKNGMIKRVGVDYYARLKKIVLTDKAIEIQKTLDEKFAQLESNLSKDISDEELETFFRVLSKIPDNIGEGSADD